MPKITSQGATPQDRLSSDTRVNRKLEAISKRVTFKKNEIIIEPTVEISCSYRIISGLVGVYTLNKGEKNSFVIYGTNELFSLEWLIDRGRVGLYYEALEDCTLECYPNDDFATLLKSDASVGFYVLSRLLNQSMIYKARLDNLEYQYASQRLAYRLLLLSRRFGVKTKNGTLLPILSNQRIARTVNLTRESVNRELSKFIKLHLISLEGNRILIIDEPGLRLQVVSTPQAFYFDNFNNGQILAKVTGTSLNL